jgi:hypothetical protein
METEALVQQPQQPQTPGVMNWVESINYFVGKGKVSRAAIYDNGGKPLAGSPDIQIPDQDVRAISACVSIPVNVYHRTRFGLFIGQVRYICFKVDNSTVIGITKDELFVAHHCDNVLILAFVPVTLPESSTSCLGEVWTFAQELKSHMEVSQFVQ